MRLLRADLLRQFARAPLNTLSILDLRRCGVENVGTDLKECSGLEILLLSENMLKDINGIESCHGQLWKLDLRNNKICDLSAFASFEHVGEVDLGMNQLTYSELVKIAHVNIMSLHLDGNSRLIAGEDEDGLTKNAKRRRNLVYLLPLVWILDGGMVTTKERETANAYFAYLAENGTEDELLKNILALRNQVGSRRQVGEKILVPRVGNGESSGATEDGSKREVTTKSSDKSDVEGGEVKKALTDGKAVAVPSIFAWGSSQIALLGGVTSSALDKDKAKDNKKGDVKEVKSWDWARPAEIPLDVPTCHVFRDWVLNAPIQPRLHDKYRAPHIIALHNRCELMLSKYFEVNVPRVGLSIIDRGRLNIEKLLDLPKRTRLDLAIMLAISVYFDVPSAILQDALSLLLKMEIDDKYVEHIGLLPRYGRALLCLALRSIALEEATGVSTDDGDLMDARKYVENTDQSEEQYSEIEYDLLCSLSPTLHGSVDERFYTPPEGNNAMSLELQARHAIILLSRSPSFPPLLQKKELSSAGIRANYNRLLPLLLIGGMAAADLESESDGADLWRQAVRNPTRQYSKPWAEAPASQTHDAGTERLDEKELSNSPEENEPSLGLSSIPAGILLENEPSGSASFYKASRLPNIGESVEISFNDGNRYFPKIVGLTKQNNMVQLEPLANYIRKSHNHRTAQLSESTKEIWLSVRELFWNPNGYWKHSSAASAGAQRLKLMTQMRSSKLHRTSSSLSRSGVPLSSGVSNAALLPQPLYEGDDDETAGKAEVNREPRTVGGFSADGTWDQHFVLAPPELVHAQNLAAGSSGGWNVVGEHDFQVNSGPLRDVLSVEVSKPLGVPPPSPIFKLLQTQLIHNELHKKKKSSTSHESKKEEDQLDPKTPGSNGASSSTSLFELTSLPAEEKKDSETKHEVIEGGPASATPTAKRPEESISHMLENDVPHSQSVPSLHPKPRLLAPPDGFGSHEERMLRLAPVQHKKKAAGPTAWYVKQGKSTMIVDQFNYATAWSEQQKRILSGRGLQENPKSIREMKSIKRVKSERSRLVQRVALLRKKASRTRFSTIEAEADNTIRISAEKGKNQLSKLNVVPHEFVPINEAIPTPLLPNKALNHGVRAKARQIRVNRYRRSLGEIRREKRLVIAGRVSEQRAVNPSSSNTST